jgi:protein-S-isoprenylcysteine O-methyltransferase Ste14
VAPHRSASHLVTAGAFALSRNPIYLADTLVMIGIGLISGIAWFLLLAPLAGFLTQKLAIEPEERHLEARFGKKYRDYRKRVRRWI